MKTAVILLVVALSCVESKDLIVGQTQGNTLLWQEHAEYSSFPSQQIVKRKFFSDPGKQIFKGVVARDLDNKGAEAFITSGGVGSTYVNFRLKSPTGVGLNYHLEVYV